MSKQDMLNRMVELQERMESGRTDNVEATIDEHNLLICKLAIINTGAKGTKDLSELSKAKLIETIDTMATVLYLSSWDANPSIVMKQAETVEADDGILVQKEIASPEV